MPIIFHPNPGQILLCDFSDFKEPEMVKKNRPVIVLSSALKGRDKLLTIVPLSTVKPDPIQPYHYLLPKKSMPMIGIFQEPESWVKGDMLYTVGFHRLNLIKLNTRNVDGKRDYFRNKLGREQWTKFIQINKSVVIYHRNYYNLIVPALLLHQAFETTQRSAQCSWHNKMEMTILVDAT